MQLTVEELQNKHKVLSKENQEFADKVRAEIAQANQNIQTLQQALQAKATEAQRTVDLADGKIKGLEDLIKEMGGVPEGRKRARPAPKNDEKSDEKAG